jgi:hypothetical protein
MITITLTVLAALAALQQPAAQAPAPAAARELHFCTQHGPVFVRLQRDQGAGVYSILGNGDIGAFVGTLDGRTLEGRWYETDSRGDIRITFNDRWNAIDLRTAAEPQPLPALRGRNACPQRLSPWPVSGRGSECVCYELHYGSPNGRRPVAADVASRCEHTCCGPTRPSRSSRRTQSCCEGGAEDGRNV